MVTALARCRPSRRGSCRRSNGYLTKPFTPDQLFEEMDKALAWRHEHETRGTHGEINFNIRSEATYLQQANDMLADLLTPAADRPADQGSEAGAFWRWGNAIEWGHRENAGCMLLIAYRIDPEAITLDHSRPRARLQPDQVPAPRWTATNRASRRRNEAGDPRRGFGIMNAKGLVDEFRY